MSKKLPSYRVWTQQEIGELEQEFHAAVYQGNVKHAEKCIKKGIDPNVVDDDGTTALHHAAIRQDIPMGKMLLRFKKVDINRGNAEGVTPLIFACIYENADFVKLLLAKGANPNLMNNKMQRAVHLAVSQQNFKIAEVLIMERANLNVTDVFDNTPLSIAVIDQGSKLMAKLLLRNGASATKTKEFPMLLECVLNCNTEERLETLELLMKYDVDIYCFHPISKKNCLHFVALTGYLPAAKFLVPLGETNLKDADLAGRTPVDIARDHQNWDVYKYFVKTLERTLLVVSFADDILLHVYKLFEDEEYDEEEEQ